MSNLREQHLKRKAQSAALKYLAEQKFKARNHVLLCLWGAFTVSLGIAIIYLTIQNIGV
jgi:hypothetical protein